jgi:hypothetical protein
MVWSRRELRGRRHCVVVDPDSPRRNWKVGSIVGVHPGGDGLVRVVDVKVGDCTYRRSISRISRLEFVDK